LAGEEEQVREVRRRRKEKARMEKEKRENEEEKEKERRKQRMEKERKEEEGKAARILGRVFGTQNVREKSGRKLLLCEG